MGCHKWEEQRPTCSTEYISGGLQKGGKLAPTFLPLINTTDLPEENSHIPETLPPISSYCKETT